ncbi:MAG: tetratricopeptide repeat protein [Saprospiraceae bacterium]
MFFKTIIQGRLEFSSQKSFDKVLKMYQYRTESYYKNDVLLEEEEIFNRDSSSLYVKRFVVQASEKSWRNTVSLLDYCSQFAISGSVKAWMTDNGKIMRYSEIEPESDKSAVIQFKKGKKYSEEEGKETEAIQALSKAIEKHNGHANAYEKRARVLLQLENYDEALEDYGKAIKLDDGIADAYYGRAEIYIRRGEWQNAISDLEWALKKAIALEPMYWTSRLKKADCHIRLGEWEKASFDLKFFTNRVFKTDNPNYFKKAYSYVRYGQVLMEEEKYDEAYAAFCKAVDNDQGTNRTSMEEMLYYRGFSRMKMGKKGYLKDIKTAAQAGVEDAKTFLADLKR